jgi:hypothetical protein
MARLWGASRMDRPCRTRRDGRPQARSGLTVPPVWRRGPSRVPRRSGRGGARARPEVMLSFPRLCGARGDLTTSDPAGHENSTIRVQGPCCAALHRHLMARGGGVTGCECPRGLPGAGWSGYSWSTGPVAAGQGTAMAPRSGFRPFPSHGRNPMTAMTSHGGSSGGRRGSSSRVASSPWYGEAAP